MTDRQQFEVSEARFFLWSRQRGKCAYCGKLHPYPHDLEIAHIIPQTKGNLAKYGKRVIHHTMNIRAVCRGSSRCNSGVAIGQNPVREKRLVLKINQELRKEEQGETQ